MKTISTQKFKKAWFTFEEIEKIKKGLKDIREGRTISHEEVKLKAREKLFSKQKIYA